MKKLLVPVILTALFYGCAPKQEAAQCTPNFQGNGMNIRMTMLRTNDNGTVAYSIKLCGDAKPSPTVYSIYGAAVTETGINNPVGQVRAKSVERSSHSGAQFEVDFRDYDKKFFVFQDQATSTGYALDTRNEMVSGDLSMADYAGGSASDRQ